MKKITFKNKENEIITIIFDFNDNCEDAYIINETTSLAIVNDGKNFASYLYDAVLNFKYFITASCGISIDDLKCLKSILLYENEMREAEQEKEKIIDFIDIVVDWCDLGEISIENNTFYRDALNNIGLPQLADMKHLSSEYLEIIEKQNKFFINTYGDSYKSHLTHQTIKALIEQLRGV